MSFLRRHPCSELEVPGPGQAEDGFRAGGCDRGPWHCQRQGRDVTGCHTSTHTVHMPAPPAPDSCDAKARSGSRRLGPALCAFRNDKHSCCLWEARSCACLRFCHCRTRGVLQQQRNALQACSAHQCMATDDLLSRLQMGWSCQRVLERSRTITRSVTCSVRETSLLVERAQLAPKPVARHRCEPSRLERVETSTVTSRRCHTPHARVRRRQSIAVRRGALTQGKLGEGGCSCSV